MFGLFENPFVVLGITPRSTKADIHDAVEDALLDAECVDAERRLDIARQALIAPNERLRAELSYLLEMRPAEARKALKSRTFDHWFDIARSAVGVSQANALAEAISCSPDVEHAKSAFETIFDSWARIDAAEVNTRINEDRSVSGFSKVKLRDVRQGLDELRDFHAAQALRELDRNGRLSSVLADLLSRKIIPAGQVGERFSAALLAAYSRHIGGDLASATDRALSSLESYVATSSDQAFAAFEKELKHWDELAQPLQLASETKGADEAHSKELYDKIRSETLNLANEEDRHQEALKVTELATQVFAELPWAADTLKNDAEALRGIIANEARERFLLPLATALKQAQENLASTSRQLSFHGFVSAAPDPIGALWRSYASLLSSDTDVEVRDLGAGMVRSLSIALFNEREAALEAKILTSQLVADAGWFSAGIRKQIGEDEEHLARSLQMQHLTDAMKRENWKRAKELCEDLARITPASEINDIRKIERDIDRKLSARSASKVLWGGIAAVVLLFIVFGGSGSSDYESDYDYAAGSDQIEVPTDDAIPASSDPTMADVVEEGEVAVAGTPEMPMEVAPVYNGGTLSLAELRYCMRQSERLDLARGMANSGGQTERFNAAIDDFNFRCSSFQYDEFDMATVRLEISGMREELRSDAVDIVGGNSSSPVPSYTAPSANALGNGDSEPAVLDEWQLQDDEPLNSNNPYGEPNEDYPW